ncbi:MAG: tRNA 2-thiouridine(34) synthase MnmA [Candidatus Lindowbacteria bacterium]|nr:tRNA 2-thiouridine(34) synthase MnmA [Candidatus Lindowbacteria bacterium]
MSEKIVALMSGGVDSSTAAAILLQRGFQVIGITMKVWEDAGPTEEFTRRCCSAADADDARRVCALLNIPHYVSNAKAAFRRYVVDPFCKEYLTGRTPNPCIVCNTDIKFRLMLRRAHSLGAAGVATGHYARITRDSATERFLLLKGRDATKDQSYFLYNLTQSQLAHISFPVGELTKTQVRAKAREFGLPTAQKPESQEICFVPDGDYRKLLEKIAPDRLRPGPILDVTGRRLGEHMGIANYTIGQRRGLGIAHPKPLYVVGFNVERNAVIVGTAEHVWARELVAEDLNWISVTGLRQPMRLTARIRYKHIESPALVSPLDRNSVLVRFDHPQRSITPGQAVVFYDGDVVVGGGIIKK